MTARLGTIQGVSIRNLRRIHDDRGFLMEIFRSDWPEFQKFGQTYMTTCKPGVVKGWHYHKLQWDHFVPIKGNALVALYDSRMDSPTRGIVQEVEVWEKEPKFVKIPPARVPRVHAAGRQRDMGRQHADRALQLQGPGRAQDGVGRPVIGYMWRKK